MTTRLIGLKDFRQNLASYTKTAQQKNIRYVILKKNVPVLEIKPIKPADALFERLAMEIAEARQQVKRGKVYTEDQIMKEFGLL
ncbi:MAG: hypothetical protein ACD_41C00299G0004 [uncultured bacterium]|nr:MAG: hypothetical protein ACD_41C00299G0004 [uncultured bacterium]